MSDVDTQDLPVMDDLLRELQSRLAAHHADPDSSESWESVDLAVFGND
jgi:hypothetical protein